MFSPALPAPVVTISESSGSRTIGQPFFLTCSVRAVPHLVVSPSIQWTRQDGRVVNSSTGSELWLSFNLLKPTDSSVYTCQSNITITDIASVSGQASEEIRKYLNQLSGGDPDYWGGGGAYTNGLSE